MSSRCASVNPLALKGCASSGVHPRASHPGSALSAIPPQPQGHAPGIAMPSPQRPRISSAAGPPNSLQKFLSLTPNATHTKIVHHSKSSLREVPFGACRHPPPRRVPRLRHPSARSVERRHPPRLPHRLPLLLLLRLFRQQRNPLSSLPVRRRLDPRQPQLALQLSLRVHRAASLPS